MLSSLGFCVPTENIVLLIEPGLVSGLFAFIEKPIVGHFQRFFKVFLSTFGNLEQPKPCSKPAHPLVLLAVLLAVKSR